MQKHDTLEKLVVQSAPLSAFGNKSSQKHDTLENLIFQCAPLSAYQRLVLKASKSMIHSKSQFFKVHPFQRLVIKASNSMIHSKIQFFNVHPYQRFGRLHLKKTDTSQAESNVLNRNKARPNLAWGGDPLCFNEIWIWLKQRVLTPLEQRVWKRRGDPLFQLKQRVR